MNFRVKSKFSRILSIILTVIISCGATFTGAYAATSNNTTPNNIVGSKTSNKQVFNLTDGFSYTSGDFRTGVDFTLNEDTTIQISTKIMTEYGELNFFIQPMGTNNNFANGYIVDENGLPKETVFEIKGSKVDKTTTIFLKAGDYCTALLGTEPVRSANWEIVGIIGSDGNAYDNKKTQQEERLSVFDKNTVYVIKDGKIIVPFSIDSITTGYVCLGQIPNIDNAKRITYAANADSGKGLFVAMSIEDKSITNLNGWDKYFDNSGNNDHPNLIDVTWDNSKTESQKDNDYTGNYFLYVGTTKTPLTNVIGTITIEY